MELVRIDTCTYKIIQFHIFIFVAGKSTTMSIITRDVLPTSGTVYIGGVSVLEDFYSSISHLGERNN